MEKKTEQTLRRIAHGDNPTIHFRKPSDLSGAVKQAMDMIDHLRAERDSLRSSNNQMRNARDELMADVNAACKRFDFTFRAAT